MENKKIKKDLQDILVDEFGEYFHIQEDENVTSWNFIEEAGYMCSIEFLGNKLEIKLNSKVFNCMIDKWNKEEVKEWVNNVINDWCQAFANLVESYGLLKIKSLKTLINDRKEFTISFKDGALEIKTESINIKKQKENGKD